MKLNRNNLLRAYDQAVVTWLKSLPFATNVFGVGTTETVQIRMGSTDKAFGEDIAIEANTQMNNLFPEIAVTRMNPSLDLSRNVRGVVNKWGVNKDGQGMVTSYKNMEVPKPYTIPYQIDLRADSIPMMNQMIDLVMYDLSPSLTLSILFPEPFKPKYGTVFLQGITSQPSPMQLAEGEAPMITTTIDVAIEGWLYQDKIETLGLPIETVETTYQTMDGEPLI